MALRGGCFVPEEVLPEVVGTVLPLIPPLIPKLGTLDAWPVGSIFTTTRVEPPEVIFGGGTWEVVAGGGQATQWERTA